MYTSSEPQVIARKTYILTSVFLHADSIDNEAVKHISANIKLTISNLEVVTLLSQTQNIFFLTRKKTRAKYSP